MCGIAGFVNRDPTCPADVQLLQRMTRTLVHRGPDEEGYFAVGPVGLGMRRLCIIDLAGGQQPIPNEDRTIWVVFNGEIYNFRALRGELESRGHRFTTNSDTEVIVHLYEERGADCVQALRGMFAFAIWDTNTQTLLLARDRFGKKPLYYAETAEGFWFGSELKAVLCVPGLSRELDPAALDDYLALGYIPAPHSIFRAVQKLPAASVLELRAGRSAVRRYWRLGWQPDASLTERQALEGLHAHLEDAVGCRLVADVPFGAFLSGGVDSTTVVWLMSRTLPEPVKTFSIGFDHQEFDELPFAREVAQAFGTEHYEQVVVPDAIALLPALVASFDEPFGDSSAIPTYLVSRLARQHVTMALSGDGGDELFAGYERYQRYLLIARLRWVLLGAAGASVLAATLDAMGTASARLNRFAAALRRAALPPLARYAQLVGLYAPELRQELLGSGDRTSRDVPAAIASAWQDALSFDPVRRLQAVDTETYLVDDVLVKVDRAAMANSLESRAPLLDHRLWEYVAALPTNLKVMRGEAKYLLRCLLRDYVPATVLSRPKQGFAVPLSHWFRGEWQEVARPLLLEGLAGQYFDRRCMERMLSEHAAGRFDHGEHLWLLLVFAVWHQQYLSR
ncbi:MAG: asparagine synthase (glutamine-hydrolyzing) [Deltaproteobacteria bacterium]|nr:asparagine synthase (glutamine-hydrolyzing) [Deltaproteobacteria bacterium]